MNLFETTYDREAILKRDGYRCYYCGWRGGFLASLFSSLEIDHMVPKRRGGTSDPQNLTTACTGCNPQKGDMTALEYFVWRRHHPDEANYGPKPPFGGLFGGSLN